jgi:hypothetical protein
MRVIRMRLLTSAAARFVTGSERKNQMVRTAGKPVVSSRADFLRMPTLHGLLPLAGAGASL